MDRHIRKALWGAGFVAALAVGLTAPASAGPVLSAGMGIKAAAPEIVADVGARHRSAKKHRRVYHGYRAPYGYGHPYGYGPGYSYGHGYRYPYGPAPRRPGPFEPGDVDTVGSLGHDGHGYAYNRFSGQRYYSCVIDLGYGRVQPCDAGGRR